MHSHYWTDGHYCKFAINVSYWNLKTCQCYWSEEACSCFITLAVLHKNFLSNLKLSWPTYTWVSLFVQKRCGGSELTLRRITKSKLRGGLWFYGLCLVWGFYLFIYYIFWNNDVHCFSADSLVFIATLVQGLTSCWVAGRDLLAVDLQAKKHCCSMLRKSFLASCSPMCLQLCRAAKV